MNKLEIKTIKGNKYLYIKYKIKVNDKSISNSLYVGRLEKLTLEDFKSKLEELHSTRLTKFTEYWLKRHYQYLDEKKAHDLEIIHHNYLFLKEHFPDEITGYSDSVFVQYVQGTTAIEGNTITPKQADDLLEHGVTPAGKSIREVYEVMNFRKLDAFLDKYDGDITESFIKRVHGILTDNLLESPGTYRRIQVMIEKAKHEPPPAFEVPELMKELVKWYRGNTRKMNPFELAVLLHTKFVTIHPFVDGNGRVARALMNVVLEQRGYPTLYFGIEHREAYLDAVGEGNCGDYLPIVEFMFDVYFSGHEEGLRGLGGVPLLELPGYSGLVGAFVELQGWVGI